MENNIFFKQNKDKYNPDIENKLKNKDVERINTSFNMSTIIYNPITNIVPNKISDSNDLVLEKDSCLTKVDIMKLIAKKEEERVNQDANFKPVKTKVINENIPSKNTNIKVPQLNNNYISTYNELKNGPTKGVLNRQPDKINDNQNKIIQGLKELGIFK